MSAFLNSPDVYSGFGFWSQPSVYPGIILFGMGFAPIMQRICSLITHALDHSFELAAGKFLLSLRTPELHR